MPRPSPKTTGPADPSTITPESAPPCPVLVIAWSKSQPHRIGEVAFFPYDEPLFVGRPEDAEFDKFSHFIRHLPGETPAVDPNEEMLSDSISRKQVVVRSTGAALEVEKLGQRRTCFNGVERDSGILQPGDTLRIGSELLLLCVLRPRIMVRPPSLGELHAYGEADADGMVGESPEAWRMRADLAKTAAVDDHAYVKGESGTGKELMAAGIHKRSKRAATGKFVACNASAITPSLLVAELFGSLENFPNHGMSARPGYVGATDRGTLFLDEIGDLSLDAQANLLRVLESGEYQRVGESTARRADLRIVGATNRDDTGFRCDFLPRLTLRVHLTPLRQRREDIALLILHLLRARARRYPALVERWFTPMSDGRLVPKLSTRFVDFLVRHDLPGNVRELRNILVESIQTSEGDELTIPPSLVPAPSPPPPPSLLPSPSMALLRDAAGDGPRSKEEVVAALARVHWKPTRAAKALGMSRHALYRYMREHGIKSEPDHELEE
jgi:DNA-binding NtrC family response regulator